MCGLPKNWTQQDMESVFSESGKIITSRILFDNMSGKTAFPLRMYLYLYICDQLRSSSGAVAVAKSCLGNMEEPRAFQGTSLFRALLP